MKERTDGGISCSEVLAHLSDFVDGTLEADVRAKVQVHLQSCSNCAEFGGSFHSMVRALAGLAPAEAPNLVDAFKEDLKKT